MGRTFTEGVERLTSYRAKPNEMIEFRLHDGDLHPMRPGMRRRHIPVDNIPLTEQQRTDFDALPKVRLVPGGNQTTPHVVVMLWVRDLLRNEKGYVRQHWSVNISPWTDMAYHAIKQPSAPDISPAQLGHRPVMKRGESILESCLTGFLRAIIGRGHRVFVGSHVRILVWFQVIGGEVVPMMQVVGSTLDVTGEARRYLVEYQNAWLKQHRRAEWWRVALLNRVGSFLGLSSRLQVRDVPLEYEDPMTIPRDVDLSRSQDDLAMSAARSDMRQQAMFIQGDLFPLLAAELFGSSKYVRDQMAEHGYKFVSQDPRYAAYGMKTIAGSGDFGTRLAIDHDADSFLARE